MNSLIRTFVCLVFFFFINNVWADAKFDAELTKKIIGRWQELRNLECELHQQVMDMHRNGTFQVNGVIRSCEGIRSFIWRGTWVVKNGKMKYKTTYSSPKEEFAVGEEWEDEIISVSSHEWIMREQSTGKESHAFKVK